MAGDKTNMEGPLTQAPEPTCDGCGIELLWCAENIGLARYRCPRCGKEQVVRYRPLIPKDSDSVIVSVLWITRQPTVTEIEGIKQCWPELGSVSTEELMSRFAGTEEIALGTLPWPIARSRVEEAWRLGVSADYAMAEFH